MKMKSLLMAVTTGLSASGTVMAAQTLAKDYAQSVHTQAKIGTELVKPWHKGYQQDVSTWSKLDGRVIKNMARMYNHGIKRV